MSKPYTPTLRPGEPAESPPEATEVTKPSGVEVVTVSDTASVIEQLRAENAALRARVAELESQRAREPRISDVPLPSQRGAAYDATEQRLGGSWQILVSILDNSPSVIFVKDLKSRYVLVNRRMEELLGRSRDQVFGMTDRDNLPEELGEKILAEDREIIATGKPLQSEDVRPTTEGVRDFLTLKFPLYDERGALTGICGISTDITERKRAEEARVAMQEQLIAAQRDELRELSTPLVPIAEGVLAMPLVGSIDAARAGQIMEALLEGIGSRSAHTAILDITGVRVVDAAVASALLQAARAARLLGARVVITGIRAEVAQTLVQIEADLGDVVTLSTLQRGIAFALRR